MIHFWLIFVRGNAKWGWRVYERTLTGVTAYPTRKAAAEELKVAQNIYGNAQLYKFKPEAFILGASK
jgi:hypothetical protein